MRLGKADPTLTGVSGLADFGGYLRQLGIDGELRRRFFRLKDGPMVVYGMENQLRLLIDANVVGEHRVFGLEALAADPLFVHLAGGVVPSLDTVYRDLCRFDPLALAELEELMAKQGAAKLPTGDLHIDIDTTVECVFGSQQGALPGPNPRYHARPSYHPIVARIPEVGSYVGAVLRPGNTGFGHQDAKHVRRFVRRTKRAARPNSRLCARIDSGGDCAQIMKSIDDEGVFFIVKAKLSPELLGAIFCETQWTSVDWDADGRPIRQVADIEFQRASWLEVGKRFRVVAMRARERNVGKQLRIWDDDWTVQAYFTNDTASDADDIAREYDGRAEVEPGISELKHAWGIGKVPSQDFNANHAALLIKLLAHNLARRYIRHRAPPELAVWSMHWWRRVWFCVPGRLTHSGRQWTLRTPPRSLLSVWLH